MPFAATTPLPSWLPDVSRDLSRAELRDVVEAVADDREAWEPHVHHDPDSRHFVQLHRDPHLDVWLICWTNSQDTGLHDHDVSAGAVHVCRGNLLEDRLELREGMLERVWVDRRAGATFDFDASHVHAVRHPQGRAPAVSIHAYSPALWRMGYYDIGEDGLLRRTSISYAEEIS
ncbi:MAG: cysteine dioxygenase family protein [Actinomycetota bacterium]